jgi:hypothetical protein
MQIGEGANWDDIEGLEDGNGTWDAQSGQWAGLADNNGHWNGKSWSDLRGLADGNGSFNTMTQAWQGLADGNGVYNSQSGAWNGLADNNGRWNGKSWSDLRGLGDGNGVWNAESGDWTGLASNNGVYNGTAWSDLAQGYIPAVLDTNAGPAAMDMNGYFGQAAAPATWSGRVIVKDAATGMFIPFMTGGKPGNVLVSLMAGDKEIAKVAADAGGNAAFMNMTAPVNAPLTYKIEASGYESKVIPASSGTVTEVALMKQHALAGMNVGTWLLVAGVAGLVGWNLWKK